MAHKAKNILCKLWGREKGLFKVMNMRKKIRGGKMFYERWREENLWENILKVEIFKEKCSKK